MYCSPQPLAPPTRKTLAAIISERLALHFTTANDDGHAFIQREVEKRLGFRMHEIRAKSLTINI